MAFKSVDDTVTSSDEILYNVQIYKGEHSITFTKNGVSKNTWSDWGLIPSSRPSEPVNGIWSRGVSIQGVNGQEDLVRRQPYHAVNSSALLNDALNRDNPTRIKSLHGYDILLPAQGSFGFLIADQNHSFFAKQQEILNFLHNQEVTMVFSDDLSITYTIRATIDSFESSSKYSGVSINYTVLSST